MILQEEQDIIEKIFQPVRLNQTTLMEETRALASERERMMVRFSIREEAVPFICH